MQMWYDNWCTCENIFKYMEQLSRVVWEPMQDVIRYWYWVQDLVKTLKQYLQQEHRKTWSRWHKIRGGRGAYTGIILYLQYQSAYPFFFSPVVLVIGSPRPLSLNRVCPPLEPKGRGSTLACGWGGGGSQFGRLERKPGTLWGGGGFDILAAI